MAVDAAKLERFMGKIVGDLGAAISAALVVIGDQLGLYKALASGGPATPAELATRTGTSERYVREWLSAQAPGGSRDHETATAGLSLHPERAMVVRYRPEPGL